MGLVKRKATLFVECQEPFLIQKYYVFNKRVEFTMKLFAISHSFKMAGLIYTWQNSTVFL